MNQKSLPTTNFPPESVSLPPHSTVPPQQAFPIVGEKATMKASWVPARSELHFIAGGSVSSLLHDITRRAERVFLAGWVGCAED